MKQLVFLIIFLMFIPKANTSSEATVQRVYTETPDFILAFSQIEKWEGGYGNDATDEGGETYCGISRKSHPNWAGWGIIDSYPLKYNQKLPELETEVMLFYKRNYWDNICLDRIPDQALAEKMFNISVNMGTGYAIKYLITGIETLEPGKTFSTANKRLISPKIIDYLRSRGNDKVFLNNLIKVMNNLQVSRYIGICRDNPSKSGYLKSWLKRCN